jgi:hypothetical protein
MNRKDLRELAEDPRFIPGIYNYCDRWCERCPFTSRCLLYATEKEDSANDPAARDISNAAFWDNLHAIFEQTKLMLVEIAEERGIDLNAVDVSEEEERHRRRQKKARKDELARQSFSYIKTVDKWFKREKRSFKEKAKELGRSVLMGIPGQDPEAEASDLSDAVEVIRWYQHQIHVKLMRALIGAADVEEEEDEEGVSTHDSDGSAKVALIGIDRSIAAWARLREHFPDRADAILDLLVNLERLRRRTETKFPRARAFRRPGFDDDTPAG